MPDITQIQVGTTTYDLVDEIARKPNILYMDSGIKAKSSIRANTFIVADENGEYFELDKNSTPFNINFPILYTQSEISTGEIGRNVLIAGLCSSYITIGSIIGIKTGNPCYIIGSLSGTIFTPNANYFVTTNSISTTYNDKYFILLGECKSSSDNTTNYGNINSKIYLYPEHKIFYKKNNSLILIEDLKAPLNSPEFTGTPTAPTALIGTSTMQLATTGFVQQEISTKANIEDLKSLAFLDSISYTSDLITNKPTLGTMSTINDAPSDNKEYIRKNGNWEEIISEETSYVEKTFYVNPSSGSDTNDGTSTLPFQTVQHAIDEGSNLGFTIINISGNITEDITITEKTIYINYTEHNKTFTGNISISNKGYLEFIGNGMSYTIVGDIEIIENSNLRFGKESVTVSGTINLVDSYLSAYSELTVSTQVSDRKTGIIAEGASQVSIDILTIYGYRGVEVRNGAVAFIGTLAGSASTPTRTVGGYIFVGSKAGQFYNKEDIDGKLLLKADINDLGDLAYIDDAPSNGGEYVRKNGTWSELTSTSGSNIIISVSNETMNFTF